jgi:hypothetical protein
MSFTDDFEDGALADIYAAVGEDVLVYPVSAPQVAGYGGTPATVRGMFVRRDAVMSDGATQVGFDLVVLLDGQARGQINELESAGRGATSTGHLLGNAGVGE